MEVPAPACWVPTCSVPSSTWKISSTECTCDEPENGSSDALPSTMKYARRHVGHAPSEKKNDLIRPAPIVGTDESFRKMCTASPATSGGPTTVVSGRPDFEPECTTV